MRPSLAQSERIAMEAGGFSHPSKMPCPSYSLPASRCRSDCPFCYAKGGCYLFRSTVNAMARRMSHVDDALASPASARRWVKILASALNERAATGREPIYRWHDSGDLQSARHLQLILRVAALTPTVAHWLPTREPGLVRSYLEGGGTIPTNVVVRLSMMPDPKAIPRALDRLAQHDRVALAGIHGRRARLLWFEECQAYSNDHKCGDCRACWDPKRNVSYPLQP
jgi:hypothetical protein